VLFEGKAGPGKGGCGRQEAATAQDVDFYGEKARGKMRGCRRFIKFTTDLATSG